MRLELTTLCLEGRCSSQLSYTRKSLKLGYCIKNWESVKIFLEFYFKSILPVCKSSQFTRKNIFFGLFLIVIFFVDVVISMYCNCVWVSWYFSCNSLWAYIYQRKNAMTIQVAGIRISKLFFLIIKKYEPYKYLRAA